MNTLKLSFVSRPRSGGVGPGVAVIPAYNIQFLVVISKYFADLQFPSHIKICLWWSADHGNSDFTAYLGQMFRDGKTGLHAIFTTSPACNLEQHCRGVDPRNPEASSTDAFGRSSARWRMLACLPFQTANILIFATPRAEAECANIAGQDGVDDTARSWWEDGIRFGF